MASAHATWRGEYQRLVEDPHRYRHLNAAQLLKHYLGVRSQFPDRRVTLAYLYWEPINAHEIAACSIHAAELAEFEKNVRDPTVRFLEDAWLAGVELTRSGRQRFRRFGRDPGRPLGWRALPVRDGRDLAVADGGRAGPKPPRRPDSTADTPDQFADAPESNLPFRASGALFLHPSFGAAGGLE